MIDYSEGSVREDQSIWHYKHFAQFVSILQKPGPSLWFSRLDCLADPFEGRSEHSYKSRLWEKSEAHTRKGCVNCWTIEDEESELMWYAYASTFGVAIRSTKGMLKSSFIPPDADSIVINTVEYGTDWSKAPSDLPYTVAFQKRRRFKGERELRALIPYEYEYDRDGRIIEPSYAGRRVPVQLSSLIADVWVAPNSPEWFKKVVELELENYCHSNILVRQSA